MEKKTGIELIAKERQNQIEKHGSTTKKDVRNNSRGQLAHAAVILVGISTPVKIYNPTDQGSPEGWFGDLWESMVNKSYRDRVIIAGALLAAELDRLNEIN